MEKNSNSEFNADWYKVWMQQSRDFFDSAEKNLQSLFAANKFVNPEEHRQQINAWLDLLKDHWQFNQLQDEHKSYQTYWMTMTKMYNEAAEMMLKEWINRANSDHPIKNLRELYELWLNCCHEVYQRTLQSKAYQEAYGEFMNAALNFWQSALPK